MHVKRWKIDDAESAKRIGLQQIKEDSCIHHEWMEHAVFVVGMNGMRYVVARHVACNACGGYTFVPCFDNFQ